jgi:sortase A
MDALHLFEPSFEEPSAGGPSLADTPGWMTGDAFGQNAAFGNGTGPWVPSRFRRAVHSGLAALARPRTAGLVVSGCGVLILLLLGYVYFFTALSFQRAQHQLLQSVTAEPAATYNLTSGAVPSQGRAVAVLEIPALHLVDAVVQGSDAQDLRRGPGHMPTTPLPGQPGNAVIAGRRVTYGAPFGALSSLRRGQLIKVVDGYGVFRYRVKKTVTVAAGHRDVVTPTSSNRLTLVTAGPGFVPSGQLAVIADLVGSPVKGTATPRFNPAPSQLGMVGDPASGLLALVWGAFFVLLLILTAWFLRWWSQPVAVYLLAVPLLVAVGLFACEGVAGFLPATF